MKRPTSFVWGTILLLVGILMTLSELNIVQISRGLYAPIIMIAVGLIFHLFYFVTREGNEGLLVPGGILLTYGLLFLLDGMDMPMATMRYLWPLFILGPALGLFELYVFSRGKVGSMIPVFILTAVGGSFLLRNYEIASFEVVLAVVLVVIGVGLMVNAFFHPGRRYTAAAPQPGVKVEEAPPTDQTPQE